MFPSLAVGLADRGRVVGEVDCAIVTVEFGHFLLCQVEADVVADKGDDTGVDKPQASEGSRDADTAAQQRLNSDIS